MHHVTTFARIRQIAATGCCLYRERLLNMYQDTIFSNSVQTYSVLGEAVRKSVQSISQILIYKVFLRFFIFQPYSHNIFIIELSNLFSNQFTNNI